MLGVLTATLGINFNARSARRFQHSSSHGLVYAAPIALNAENLVPFLLLHLSVWRPQLIGSG
eukprot:1502049-Pleurochrysis_carterae.AAC.1